MNKEVHINLTVHCKECGSEIGFAYFSTDCNRSVYIDADVCYRCEGIARNNGYEHGMEEGQRIGYQHGYDDGYEEGCEYNIEFVDDDKPTKDIE